MIPRRRLAGAMLSGLLLATTLSAQPVNPESAMGSRVLDILFPLEVRRPYFSKMVLRYWDSRTQLVVLIYPGPPGPTGEVIRYSLSDTSSGEFWQVISRMLAENPDVKADEIAAKLHVEVTRTPFEVERWNRTLKELGKIRISPILANYEFLDASEEYEFWYDSWQESVHYVMRSPFEDEAQGKLGKWMIKFRTDLPDLLKGSSSRKPRQSGR